MDDKARMILLLWLLVSAILVFGMFAGLAFGDWSALITVVAVTCVAGLLILWDIRMRVKAIYDKLEIGNESKESVINTILRWMKQVNQ